MTDAQIEEAIKDKDYERAMTLIGLLRRGQPHRIDLHYWAAHVHVNRGDYGLAGAELEQLLQSDAFFAPAYHLWGTIHLQEQDLHRAKAALKKAIFLDPRFVMAYVTLAMAYHQEGKTAQAVREYRNAVRLLSGGPCEDEVPYSGGFTRAVLVGICQEAVERIQAEA